jgi:hypothetical protein
MDAKTSNTPSPSPATKTPRPPRRFVTYTILGGAVLTLLAVLGVQRQSRAVVPHVGPMTVAPKPRAPETPDPPHRRRSPRRGRGSSWCSRWTRPVR